MRLEEGITLNRIINLNDQNQLDLSGEENCYGEEPQLNIIVVEPGDERCDQCDQI